MKVPIAAALVIALALRIGFGLFYWVDKPLTHDEREYLLLARTIAAGSGYGYPADARDDGERFGRAPLYPVFLAAVMTLTGTGRSTPPIDPARDVPLLRSIKIAQAIVGTAGVWLIGALAAAAAGSQARRPAIWIAAAYPPLVWICAYVLSEALYATLILAAALVLGRAIDSRPAPRTPHPAPPTPHPAPRTSHPAPVFLAGILAGLAALTRPAAVFFVAVSTAWLIWRGSVRGAAWLALGALLAIGPWTLRNISEYHRVVLIASEGGITFWTGNHPLSRGEGDLAANPEIKRANVEFRRLHPGMTEEELEPLYYAEAFRYIAAHPIAWTALIARKLFYLWIPTGPSYRLHSARYYWASVVSYALLLPVALAGMLRIVRVRPTPHALHSMWLLGSSAILMCLLFFPQERFRIPVIDPLLIVCAAARVVR